MEAPPHTAPRQSDKTPPIMSNGSILVIPDRGQRNTRVRAYDITGAQPSPLWTVEKPGSYPLALTDNALLFSTVIIDTATGTSTPAPWAGQEPRLVMEDLVITCVKNAGTCSAWDLEGAGASLRWTQDLPGPHGPEFDESSIAGGTASGYAKVSLHEKSHGMPMVAFVSLADGSVHNKQGQTDEEGVQEAITPAADGWMRWSAKRSRIEPLELDGADSQSTAWPVTHEYTLLRSPQGRPTMGEYERAYSAGDISWAATALYCRTSTCTLNGQNLTMPMAIKMDRLGGVEIRKDRIDHLVDERWLVMGLHDQSTLGNVQIVDQQSYCVIDGPPELESHSAKVVIVRPDLLVAVADGSLVAYAPSQT